MAYISGIKPGLVPQESEASIEHKAKRVASQKVVVPNEVVCECCGGQIGFNTKRKVHSSPCKHCHAFFGGQRGGMFGQTSDTPHQALHTIGKLNEEGWAMVLRAGSFGSSGGSIGVEPGDIFKIERAGSMDLYNTKGAVSKERTWAIFTVQIKIGPHMLTQFTHEVSSISLVSIMKMKAAGEISEVYVSTDDQVGHFAPTPELRQEIYEAFGSMTGTPTQPRRNLLL